MKDIYLAIRDSIPGPMPPECIMAARDAITSGETLDVYLNRWGLTNREYYDYDALAKATKTVRSRQ